MSIYRILAACGALFFFMIVSHSKLCAQGYSSPNLANFPPSSAHAMFQTWAVDNWYLPAPQRALAASSAGPPKISADILRFPLSSKAKNAILKADTLVRTGDHKGAMVLLQEALVKYSRAAPYIQNMLGIEYVAVGNFPAAKDAFANVIHAMPHISANYSNYALTLSALGENDQAEENLRTALALDDKNQIARRMLGDIRKQEARENVAGETAKLR
jgi:tetratricopeptide (TPR) repeat protein